MTNLYEICHEVISVWRFASYAYYQDLWSIYDVNSDMEFE